MSRGFHRGAVCILRIAIDEEAFRTLVTGGIAQVRGFTVDAPAEVELALSDLGFEQMLAAVRDAMQSQAANDG